MHSLWSVLGLVEASETPPFRSALASIAVRMRVRCMKTLEHLFKVQSSEVLESLIECWLITTTESSVCSCVRSFAKHYPSFHVTKNFDQKATSIEVIDALTASAQIVVQMICSSISSRVVAPTRIKKTLFNPNL